jgi:hypothetical protein
MRVTGRMISRRVRVNSHWLMVLSFMMVSGRTVKIGPSRRDRDRDSGGVCVVVPTGIPIEVVIHERPARKPVP